MRRHFGILAAAYLGFALKTFVGVGLTDWQWWVILAPTLLGFLLYTDHIRDLNTKN